MDFELPEELRMLKAQVRRLVDEEMIPVERETCAGDDLKPEWRTKFEARIKDLGLWMMEIPEEYGGLGMGLLASVVVWQELARTVALPSRSSGILGPERAQYSLHARRRDEAKISVAGAARRKAGLFRADRARCRLRSRRHAHHGGS